MMFGFEREIPLLRDNSTAFVDFDNTSQEFQVIVDELPVYRGLFPAPRGRLRH